MNLGLLIRMFICVLSLGGLLYFYISKQNVITELRLQIPAIQKEFREIEQENTRLQFVVEEFESPSHLMELARKPEYRHLKHPLVKDIIEIETR
ncbi:MAG: Cell division protein FtsL [Chlamydiae bacterium]|nr:Cell division protein FtsL [Chlamydiota bacterium]